MKILLLGKTGLLGSVLFRVFSDKNELFSPSRKQCDVTNINSIRSAIEESRPNIIINATGYTNVDKAEEEYLEAEFVNSFGIENLVKTLQEKEIPLVHFSTDYVFDGAKKEGYAEQDAPNPLSAYGRSKAKGEARIINNLTKYYLIRTSWLFGENGKNFADAMLKLAKTNDEISVVDDQIGCPTYSLDLARAVKELVENKSPFGIYHLVNDGRCSWFEFAQEIFFQLGLAVKVLPITSEQLKRPAKRPKYSVLLNTKCAKLRPWQQALADYLKEKTLIL